MTKRVFSVAIVTMAVACIIGAHASELFAATPGSDPAHTLATPSAPQDTPPSASPSAPPDKSSSGSPSETTEATVKPDINAMLRHIEEQYLYLKTLDNLRAALEKERSIAKLIRECEELQVICTGKGLEEMRVVEPPAPAPVPPSAPPPQTLTLPSVLGVVSGKALLHYKGRNMSVRVGDRVGGYTIDNIGLDAITFGRRGKSIRVPVEWRAQQAQREASRAAGVQ